jgi:hypothetical protein
MLRAISIFQILSTYTVLFDLLHTHIVTVPVQLTLKLSRALRPQSRLKGIVLLRRIRLSAGGRTDRDWLSEAYVNRAPLSALFSSP